MDNASKFQEFCKDLLAGGASGIVAKCVSAPIERYVFNCFDYHWGHSCVIDIVNGM